MENSKIHEGLSKREIRMLIANDLETVLNMEIENKLPFIPYDREDVYGHIIRESQAQIKYHQKRIQLAELRKGLKAVIEMHGWSEHDVSDDTRLAAGQNSHQSFIGTEDEYEELMHKIYPQNK